MNEMVTITIPREVVEWAEATLTHFPGATSPEHDALLEACRQAIQSPSVEVEGELSRVLDCRGAPDPGCDEITTLNFDEGDLCRALRHSGWQPVESRIGQLTEAAYDNFGPVRITIQKIEQQRGGEQ